MKVLIAQSCLTICNHLDSSPPGSSVHGLFLARILQWVAIPCFRGSFQPRDQSWVSHIASKQVLYCLSQGSVSALGEPSSVVIQLGLLFKLYFWASLIAQLVKNPPAMQETWIRTLGWEGPLKKGKHHPLQYSGLENSMDYIVHRVIKSRTQLNNFHFHLIILY